MRARITILCGFLLFSPLLATPAQAGPWSAFISWLSDLDPKTGGLGIEFPIFCTPATQPLPTPKEQKPAASKWACTRTDENRFVVKGSAAFLLGTLNADGGTVFVAPGLLIVEKQMKRLYVGAGAGAIHVGGTLQGGITRGLIQFNVTAPIPQAHLAIRFEVNVIPKGFPAGTFSPGSAETGNSKLT